MWTPRGKSGLVRSCPFLFFSSFFPIDGTCFRWPPRRVVSLMLCIKATTAWHQTASWSCFVTRQDIAAPVIPRPCWRYGGRAGEWAVERWVYRGEGRWTSNTASPLTRWRREWTQMGVTLYSLRLHRILCVFCVINRVKVYSCEIYLIILPFYLAVPCFVELNESKIVTFRGTLSFTIIVMYS